jgi:putative SOS response-associated peptidase YedK
VCGRFNSLASGADFAKTFDATLIGEELVPNFNVAPTAEVYALISKQLERSNFLELSIFNWGLVPSWAKDKTKSAGMINARSETLTEKPSFKNLIARHRCVIPMQGFYEWSVISSGSSKPTKQAHYVSRADGEVMTVAGLWSTWIDPNRQQVDSTPPSILRTCTIITTDANDSLRPIHHRMPVILEKDAVAQWLDPVDLAPLGLLVPAENDVVVYEATTRLDRTRNVHSTQLIDDQTGRLF